MFIIKHKKIFIGVSAGLVLLSILSMVIFGFNIGIDFKGGALTEVHYTDMVPSHGELTQIMETLDLGNILVQPTDQSGFILKSKDINEDEHQQILNALSFEGKYSFEETNFTSIGPSVGVELTKKAIVSIILVSLGIILFIAYAFRKVSLPVSSWKYGLIAIVTLLHDVMIPVGIFVIISHFTGAEIDTLFVVAVLTILGLSVSDTIVIFDRIRENLNLNRENKMKENFADTVGKSIEQSFARSIATSMTVILALLSLVFWGPVSTKYFAMMLTAGMFFGTYSSIFLASSLLVLWQEHKAKSVI